MKKLLIMRHGKSDWETESQRDFDRPLNQRGVNDSKKIGIELKKRNLIPDIIISSPAKRAKKTAKNVSEGFNYNKETVFEESFYFGYYTEIIRKINNIDEITVTAMIVGHNPTWSDMVGKLSGKYFDMKTANVCILEFDGKWKDLKEKSCKFVNYISPKDV